MSVLQVVLSDDGARIYVDTAAGCQAPSGERLATERAKVLPLVVPNCVLAGRGNPAFLASLAATLQLAAPSDFDALAASLHQLVDSVHQLYAGKLADVAPGVSSDQELALIGWSRSRERMACVMCFVDTGALEPECIELPAGGEWLTPWAEEWGPEPSPPDSDEAAFALACEQVRRGRVAMPGVNFGGRLLAVTVTRDDLRLREVGHL